MGETSFDLPFPPFGRGAGREPGHRRLPHGERGAAARRAAGDRDRGERPDPLGHRQGEGPASSGSPISSGCSPTASGPTPNPGYPLVTFYLNAKDLASGLEFDAAQDVVPHDFFLQVSGLSVTYDMTKPAFARVTGLALDDRDGPQPLDPTRHEPPATRWSRPTTSAGFLGLVSAPDRRPPVGGPRRRPTARP